MNILLAILNMITILCIFIFVVTLYNGRRDIFLRDSMFDTPSKVFSVIANTGSDIFPDSRMTVKTGDIKLVEPMELNSAIHTVELTRLDQVDDFTPLDHPASHVTKPENSKKRFLREMHENPTSVDKRRDEFTSDRLSRTNLFGLKDPPSILKKFT